MWLMLVHFLTQSTDEGKTTTALLVWALAQNSFAFDSPYNHFLHQICKWFLYVLE